MALPFGLTPTLSAGMEKIFPVEVRSSLAANRVYPVIVLSAGADPAALEAALRAHTSPALPGGMSRARLQVIDGYAVKADTKGLTELAKSPDVRALWVLPDALFGEYVSILAGIDYTLRTAPGPGPINISLGPPPSMLPYPYPYREDEPIHLATKKASEAGKLVVMSAGNAGPQENTLNPWCVAPWVLCVGAATEDGSALWRGSSRGRPGDPLSRPGLVAPGVDVLTTHPADLPKTPDLLAAEKRFGFASRVPKDQQANHTVVTGSSFAAAHVTGAAAQLFFYLTKAREALLAKGDKDPKVAIFYRQAPLKDKDPLVTTRRLAGEAKGFEGFFVGTYFARPDPLIVKQILLDAALPMKGYREHEVGSGFIHQAVIQHLFGEYGLAEPKLLPIKVQE